MRATYKDYTIEQTAEPTQSSVGKFLRESVLSDKVPLSTKTVIRLFAADREEHLSEIRTREKGKIFTVCDRYIASNIAYQGVGSVELSAYARKQNEDFEIPFITFYLRVGEEDVPKIFERVCKRGETKEIFDKVETQKRLAQRFDDLFVNEAQTFSQYLSIVDATKTEKEVANSIWEAFVTIMEDNND